MDSKNTHKLSLLDRVLQVESAMQSQPTHIYIKERLQRGLNTFINHESFGGVLLFFCVVLAMFVANSQYGDYYFSLMDKSFGIFIGDIKIGINVLHFVNDVLMSLFFLMVGLEMKREVLYGELAGFKRVSFSILSALGGIFLPIMVYLYFNTGTQSAHGFGVAMSTDTAFALGAILLLGKRIPHVLKIFLVTLAVFDDLGAILIIAILYTNTIDVFWIYIAIVLTCLLIYFNYKDTKYLSLYVFIGILLWVAIHNSGIHATIAAVILAFAIPGRSNIRRTYLKNIYNLFEEWNNFLSKEKASKISTQDDNAGFFKSFWDGIKNFFKSDSDKKIDIEQTSKQVHLLDTISKYSQYAQNPLVKMELILQPICAYFIVPVFAFLNAGVKIDDSINFGVDGIFLGTILGLVIGKPFGILVFSFLGEKLGIAVRPCGLTYKHIFAVGVLAGIGFTMSIFVANLAFDNDYQVVLAKISILIASSIAIILGIIALYLSTKEEVVESQVVESQNTKEGDEEISEESTPQATQGQMQQA